MSIDSKQFEALIIDPVLKLLNMWSPSAVSLMLGTCAQESEFCAYLVQIGGGPGKGPYQVENPTHDDVWRYLNNVRPDIRAKVLTISPQNVDALIYNLYYSTAIARIRYWWVEEELPPADDIYALGKYWDKYYNCNPAKGTADEFVSAYRRYIK